MPISHPIIDGGPGNEKMELRFDVREFHPSEISVTTQGNMLAVRARHQEQSESGTHKSSSWKEYNRQYLLPTQVDPAKIKPNLSPEGILTIESRLTPAIEGKKKVRLAVDAGM
nr:small heat shock protein [Pareurythoe californica]